MGIVPAICKCGHIFNSNLVGGGSGTIIGCKAKCPKCGEMASIPDGNYKIGETETIIRALDIGQMNSLLIIAQQAIDERWSYEQVIEAVRPIDSKIINLLPIDKHDLLAFIAIIIGILQLFLSKTTTNNNNTVYNNIEQNYHYSDSPNTTMQYQTKSLAEPKGRDRNRPCSCGSGKKSKHCCGKIENILPKAKEWLASDKIIGELE